MKKLSEAINSANSAQLDGIWVSLRSDVGILRKLAIIAELLNIHLSDITIDLPRDDNGLILDRQSRELIHEILLPASRKKLLTNRKT